MNKYNSAMAAEYYVLSCLNRLNFDACLTLGNKKSIDIIVNTIDNNYISIDVKSLQDKSIFLLDNVNLDLDKQNHFIVFVAFKNKISDINISPDVFVIPFNLLKNEGIIYHAPKGRKGLKFKTLTENLSIYKDNFEQLLINNK